METTMVICFGLSSWIRVEFVVANTIEIWLFDLDEKVSLAVVG